MSLGTSQAFHTLEYRHGPISLVDASTLAVGLSSPETRDEEARVAADLRDRGAPVIGFGGPGDVEIDAGTEPLIRRRVALPALQIVGERVAARKGLDTAAPRHLDKVVILS